ncbi:MAG: OmpA family protein [Elusimicrobiota bacterium]
MRASWLLLLAAVLATAVFAQDPFDDAPADSGPGRSRPLQTAIKMYDRGDDMLAMDLFIDILTKGNPAERSTANEYMNLISQRMNSSGAGFLQPAAPPAAVPSAVRMVRQTPESEEEPADARAPSARAASSGQPQANREVMRQEIKAKLRNMRDKSVAGLKDQDEVRVVLSENGDPIAIGLPATLMFDSGVSFRKSAFKMLDDLTRLIFSLGGSQVTIMPEGASVGDAKIMDMRRTMAISSHLYQSGVAAPRVKVNLLNTQVDIPKSMQDFKGILIMFVHNRPLGLASDSAIFEESGPPITLGIYPQSLRPDRNEGAVMEFSVSEPPAGIMSWKFQLLQPASGGASLIALQQVVGAGPVFHQIYWNGRQNYFGDSLPPGRYECVLTATDGKNRSRTMHRWIQLLGEGQAAPAPERRSAGAAVRRAAGRAPSADLPDSGPADTRSLLRKGARQVSGVSIVRGVKAKKAGPKRAKKSALRRKKGKAAAEPAAVPDQTSARPSPPAAGAFLVAFQPNSHQLTPEGEKSLLKIAESLPAAPQDDIELMGYAQGAETDSQTLGERRAQMVAGRLINKYGVDPKRIQVRSSVSDDAGATVEVKFVGQVRP